MIFLFDNDKI